MVETITHAVVALAIVAGVVVLAALGRITESAAIPVLSAALAAQTATTAIRKRRNGTGE